MISVFCGMVVKNRAAGHDPRFDARVLVGRSPWPWEWDRREYASMALASLLASRVRSRPADGLDFVPAAEPPEKALERWMAVVSCVVIVVDDRAVGHDLSFHARYGTPAPRDWDGDARGSADAAAVGGRPLVSP
jgi:hypothetical protein